MVILATPLLAALLDQILSFAFPIIVFIVWLINQISDARRKQRMAGAQPMPRPQPPPQQQPVPAGGAQNDPLRAQIDEFLRRANQQGQPAGRPAAPPQRDDVVVLLDEAPQDRRRDVQAPTLKPAAAQGQQPRRRREKQKGQRSKSVAEHVADRVAAGAEQLRAEASHLGERVITADKQFDVQLQQKFDHRLGTLGDASGSSGPSAYNLPAAAAVPNAANQIVALLSSPDGVRQAVILNEILRRPNERW